MQCFGTYGFRNTSTGRWSTGSSSDLEACPESPNTEWCSRLCEEAGALQAEPDSRQSGVQAEDREDPVAHRLAPMPETEQQYSVRLQAAASALAEALQNAGAGGSSGQLEQLWGAFEDTKAEGPPRLRQLLQQARAEARPHNKSWWLCDTDKFRTPQEILAVARAAKAADKQERSHQEGCFLCKEQACECDEMGCRDPKQDETGCRDPHQAGDLIRVASDSSIISLD